ncbi:peptidase S9, partial [Pseudomonas aeruginosa]
AGGGESIQQPRFDPAGRLHWLSDRDGWWRPCAEVALAGRFADADHAGAPWQLGACSYLPLGEGRLLLSRVEVGGGQLFLREADGSERRLAADWNRFAGLAADARAFYCIAAAAGRLPALLAIHRDDLRVEVLRGGERPLAEDDLSHPQAFVYDLGNGENGHGFFYPPRNARRRVDPRRPAPLLVWLHGGPTSMHSPAFDAGLQFWTQRGFAVAALNYRGSSGYGRAYRQRLRGQWGRLELRDIEAALARLDAEGRIDRARVFVRGASAGGYSALRALACLDGLRGGASLYGVSDPLALARCTHKFEGDYLDWLIGDPQRQRRRYLARSPVLQAGRIRAPVVFFQGGLDAVVVPEQTEAMVAGLRRSGVRVECHRYPQERHGFRQPANRAHALLAEWRFYLGLLED